MTDLQKKIIEKYITSYNNFDIEGMVADADENIVFVNISNGEVNLKTNGLAEFKKQAESATQYFRQRKQTITSWKDNNDSTITVHIHYEAILDVDLPNGLKSGEPLSLQGRSTFEFDQGKIVKITDES